jgi:hypothetical protein
MNVFVMSFVHTTQLHRDEGLTPKIPDDCPALLAELMQMCWKKDPNQRPVSSLLNLICSFLNEIQ